jgi:AhpD family alkylhydroperoxidase
MPYTEEVRQMNRAMSAYRRDEPDVMVAFAALRRAATADGALSAKHKELIALGIASAMHCEGCIVYHVRDALRAGATRAEILEAVGVAVLMGGGPGAVYGSKVVDMIAEFEQPDARGAARAPAGD